jgi:flagellar basal-body rod protein FlgF
MLFWHMACTEIILKKRGVVTMRNTQAVAAMGAFRQQRRISDLISNNLSNVQTAGFKKDAPLFHNILDQTLDSLRDNRPDGIKTVFSQGNIQKAGNVLDVAIEGEGFFKVKTPQGIRYTRAGNFGMNKDNVLVNANGFPIMRKQGKGLSITGKQGEITLSGQTISIERDGTIKVDGGEAGQIALVTFSDLDLLRKEGNGLFRLEVPQEEMEVPDSQLLQGALESSNVNPVEEMVNLIDSLRSYESCLKIIQGHDEMDNKAVNDLGRVQ